MVVIIIVFAKHPACRNDVQLCRLSFSVAEVILLQSWKPVHQIVYHMLRFLSKRELISKDCPKEDEVLSTYHFKTVMLWSCEEMSPEWWNSSNVIQLCCCLLRKLEKSLVEKKCRNYFIPEANLFHEHFNRKIVDETTKKLIYYCDFENLSYWFLEHYLRPGILEISDGKCAHNVFSCEHMFQTLDAMKKSHPKSIDLYFSMRFRYIAKHTHNYVEEGFDSAVAYILKYMSRRIRISASLDL